MSILTIEGMPVLDDIQAVFFDKDGTLVDIHHYWASMIGIRANLIGERWFLGCPNRGDVERSLMDAMGVDLSSSRMRPEGPVGVKPRADIVRVATEVVRRNGRDINEQNMESLFQEVDQNTAEDLRPLLRLLPGAKHLLQKLKKCGIPSVIVSTDITSRARKAFEVLELDDYFEHIFGGDAVESTKPAPDLALLAIQRLECSAEKVVIVGDHPVDVKMGIAAGVGLNVGVLNGLSSESAFEDLPCKVIHDLTSLDVRCSHA